jgi:hypothetical protein
MTVSAKLSRKSSSKATRRNSQVLALPKGKVHVPSAEAGLRRMLLDGSYCDRDRVKALAAMLCPSQQLLAKLLRADIPKKLRAAVTLRLAALQQFAFQKKLAKRRKPANDIFTM